MDLGRRHVIMTLLSHCGADKPDLGIDYNKFRKNNAIQSSDGGLDEVSVV